jgi:hypothetical protein
MTAATPSCDAFSLPQHNFISSILQFLWNYDNNFKSQGISYKAHLVHSELLFVITVVVDPHFIMILPSNLLLFANDIAYVHYTHMLVSLVDKFQILIILYFDT